VQCAISRMEIKKIQTERITGIDVANACSGGMKPVQHLVELTLKSHSFVTVAQLKEVRSKSAKPT